MTWPRNGEEREAWNIKERAISRRCRHLHSTTLFCCVRVTTLVDDAMGMEKGLKMGADKFSSIITVKSFN